MAPKNRGSARKGKAVEQLIAATCVLGTGGDLNALTSLVDDEGVDLTFKRRDGTRTLDVQVKARFSDLDGSKQLREKQNFVSDVREETFRPRADLDLLYVSVDAPSAEIAWAWLVPSVALDEHGFRVTVNGKRLVRFQASAKAASSDKWSGYRIARRDLPAAVLKRVLHLDADKGT